MMTMLCRCWVDGLKAQMEHLPDISWIIDPGGGGTVWGNRAHREQWGDRSGGTLDGNTCNVHPDDLPRVNDTISKALKVKSQYPCDVVFRFTHCAGGWVWVQCSMLGISCPMCDTQCRVIIGHTTVLNVASETPAQS